MRQESICVLIICVIAATFVPGCDSGESATETIKELVNGLLSTKKNWKDITLDEKLNLKKLKKENCNQARDEKNELLNSELKDYSVAWYCSKTDEKTETEVAWLAYDSWRVDSQYYHYPGEKSKQPSLCAKKSDATSHASMNYFVMMTSLTTNQIGCAYHKLTDGNSYVICLFKTKLSDNELKGDQNVGTYIFPESEFNHLHSNMQHFVTCKGFDNEKDNSLPGDALPVESGPGTSDSVAAISLKNAVLVAIGAVFFKRII
ncbi:uncharacterized protein LOC142342450 isoform X1 [Convolutriloba macropyga]|uniref:uncharacterized protein LOC142342450 isoform X1 n=1 Tax=Convolutriloba macropyga TaxID=536237 RepID=UPI003F51C690